MPRDTDPPSPSATAEDARAPERGADNRGVPAHVLPSGEARGSGAGAGGGGGREDQDTDDPTIATPTPTPAEDHPERGGDGTHYGSA